METTEMSNGKSLTTAISEVVHGAKGGGSSRKSVESPDSLFSIAQARIIDLLSEGEIEGFPNGANFLRDIYLDETPIENADGSRNFKNLNVEYRSGSQDQDHIPGFPAVENELGIGVELKFGSPWVRSFSNRQLSAVRIRLSTPALSKTNKDNGDITGASVTYAIDVATDGGAFVNVMTASMSGKSSSTYERAHRVELPKSSVSGWSVRVRRLTPNSTSAYLQNTTFVQSVTEIIDGKFRYPMSAVVGVTVDASQFQSIPTRAYRLRGRRIRVPTNYDPVTRTYSGIWDGTFKVAYSNNPAWVYYDLTTHPRYGLGRLVSELRIDKYALYGIAQYCDGMVPDGFGGMEPRMTCNLYLQQAADAWKVINDLANVFRGIAYWAGGAIVPVSDRPSDPVYTYTNANVHEGVFTYQSTGRRARHTAVTVSYNDMNDFGRLKTDYYDDPELIERFGFQPTEVVAVGSTSRGQAQRVAKWLLLSEKLLTNLCSWGVGLDGTFALPGQIVRVMDKWRAGARMGGRIRSATASSVVFDRALPPAVAAGGRLTVILPTGVSETRTINSVAGDRLSATVSVTFSDLPATDSVWSVESATLENQLFRVLAVEKNETSAEGGPAYTLTACQHNPSLFAAVDQGDPIVIPPTSFVDSASQLAPSYVQITSAERAGQVVAMPLLTAAWPTAPGAVRYQIQWRKDGGEWSAAQDVYGTSADYSAPFLGNYEAKVQAVNSLGVFSVPRVSDLFTLADQTRVPGVVAGLIETVDQSIQDMVDIQTALDQEVLDRLQGDLNAVTQAGIDAQAKANNALALAKSYADSVAGGVSALTNAQAYDAEYEYKVGDFVRHTGGLYRAIIDNVDQGPPDPDAWEYLGAFASVGEAVAANLKSTELLADEVSATAGSVGTLAAQVGDITVEVQDVAQAVVDGDTALGRRIDSVTVTANGAASAAGNALTVADDAATNASTAMTTADNAQSAATSALNTANGLATSIEQVRAGQNTAPNALKNPTFAYNQESWNKVGPGALTFHNDAQGAYVRIEGVASGYTYLYQNLTVYANNTYSFSGQIYITNVNQVVNIIIQYYNSSNTHLSDQYISIVRTAETVNKWQSFGGSLLAPAGTSYAVAVVGLYQSDSPVFFRRLKFEQSPVPTLYSEESSISTVTQELRAASTGGGNLLQDTEFRGWPDQGTWHLVWNSQNLGHHIALNVAGPDWQPPGTNALSWTCDGANNITSRAHVVYGSKVIACEGGKWYIASAYLAAHRCVATVRIIFYDANNNNVGEYPEQPTMTMGSAQGGKLLTGWRRAYVRAQAPANATTMCIALWGQYDPGVTGGVTPYVWFVRPMIEEASAVQTLPSPWSAGGKEMAASHTVTLDVNGNISGTQSTNDGKRSTFSVLANVFRVISSGVAGMEWLNGYLRLWKGSAQLVMGHSFGSGDLVFWYGPNIGAASCSKSNATIWFDSSGGAYFGGTLSAGVLKNASQTTVLTANPSIDVGPFTTLGRTKVVTVGYSAGGPTIRAYFPGRPSNSPPPLPAVPAPEYTTLYLYRSYGGGAEQLVTSSQIGHSAIEVSADYVDRDAGNPNLPGGGWYQDYHFISTGSMTVSDTTSGTNTFKYRAYAVSGGYPRDRQALSVVSVEQ